VEKGVLNYLFAIFENIVKPSHHLKHTEMHYPGFIKSAAAGFSFLQGHFTFILGV
jgi:hypothetical protein